MRVTRDVRLKFSWQGVDIIMVSFNLINVRMEFARCTEFDNGISTGSLAPSRENQLDRFL